MNLLHKRVDATKAELLAEVKQEAHRVGKIVGRRQQGYVGQIRRRKAAHHPLSFIDGWVSATATMHPLDFDGPVALCLGGDGAFYRNGGDHYHRESIDHYNVEMLTKLLEAIRKLERKLER